MLDPVGKETLARSYKVVRRGGIIASLVARPDPAELEKYGIRGIAMAVTPDANDLAEITKLIDEKKMAPVVTQTLPLSEGKKALEQAATRHTRGKIVLQVANEPSR